MNDLTDESVTKKNIKEMVRFLYLPRINTILSRCKSSVKSLIDRIVRFRGQMTSYTDLSKSSKDGTVTFNTTVVNDGHTHNSSQIIGSVQAIPNTIVQRDNLGMIHGSGNRYGETGYKLSNGSDLSTLFRNINSFPFTTSTTPTGSYSGYSCINGVSFTINGNFNVNLQYNRSGFCSHNCHSTWHIHGC